MNSKISKWTELDTGPQEALEQFIRDAGLTMDVLPAHENPHMADPKWKADHWSCQIKRGSAVLQVYYSTGIGHRKIPAYHPDFGTITKKDHRHQWAKDLGKPVPPKLADVLDCLAMDASGLYDGVTFEDWAPDNGFDLDSRKAERIFRTIQQQTTDLRNLLGADLFTRLMDLERL